MKSVHESLKNHESEACGKSFSKKSNLEKHLKLVHENRRDFTCDVCNKKLVSNSNLERHIQQFHMVATKYVTSTMEPISDAIPKVSDPTLDANVSKL